MFGVTLTQSADAARIIQLRVLLTGVILHLSVGSHYLSHKVVLGAWVLGGFQASLLGIGHIARIGSYGVGRKLGMLRHESFYGFALAGGHTQRGIARKEHGAMIIKIITRLILAQGIGKVFINIFVAGIDNNLGKEHAVGASNCDKGL